MNSTPTILALALAATLLGPIAPAPAQNAAATPTEQPKKSEQQRRQAEQEQARQKKREAERQAQQEKKAAQQQAQQQRREEQRQARAAEQQAQEEKKAAQLRAQQERRAPEAGQPIPHQQPVPQQPRQPKPGTYWQPPAQGAEIQTKPLRRLPPQQEQELIAQQRQRTTRYHQRLQQQENVLEQRSHDLQRQRRMAQYRFHQQYLQRLRQQQIALQNATAYDFSRDPYFYTAPSFRYSRGGRYYEVNQYAAQLLQQAVNDGYEEGFRAGRADQEDHWRFDYESCFAYQDANYGYNGFYVDQDQYNHYFREGFRRGYEDGYYARYRYGVEVSGDLRILIDVLRLIIDLQPLRH
jgi:hypothetical protein